MPAARPACRDCLASIAVCRSRIFAFAEQHRLDAAIVEPHPIVDAVPVCLLKVSHTCRESAADYLFSHIVPALCHALGNALNGLLRRRQREKEELDDVALFAPLIDSAQV